MELPTQHAASPRARPRVGTGYPFVNSRKLKRPELVAPAFALPLVGPRLVIARGGIPSATIEQNRLELTPFIDLRYEPIDQGVRLEPDPCPIGNDAKLYLDAVS